MKVLLLIVLLTITFSNVFAGNDPSIKGPERSGVQSAMKEHIKEHKLKGKYVIYDNQDMKVLNLEKENLHSGIVKKGDFYVSCADFYTGKTKYDLDFLVAKDGNSYRVIQTLVHAKNGKKRAYDLEK